MRIQKKVIDQIAKHNLRITLTKELEYGTVVEITRSTDDKKVGFLFYDQNITDQQVLVRNILAEFDDGVENDQER